MHMRDDINPELTKQMDFKTMMEQWPTTPPQNKT
jgi:hypothetical protein